MRIARYKAKRRTTGSVSNPVWVTCSVIISVSGGALVRHQDAGAVERSKYALLSPYYLLCDNGRLGFPASCSVRLTH